jgi:hypothetical protein
MGNMAHIGLAESIGQLRDELAEAQQGGANQQLQFEILDMEIELLVEFRQDGGAAGKVVIGVLAVGADGRVGHAASHRLTVRLKAKDNATGGGSVDLSRPVSRSPEGA